MRRVTFKIINSVKPNQAQKYIATSLTKSTNHFNIPRNFLARICRHAASSDCKDRRDNGW